MVARLSAAGHPVVAWTRDPRGKRLPRGVVLVPRPENVAARCDVVLGCLLDDAAVDRVYLADDGLLRAARTGTVFVEHGSFSPGLAEILADKAHEHGATFVDVPVTGGPEGADAGTLIGMAGGSSAALGAATLALRTYLAVVHEVGGPGSGLRLKLVNQYLVSAHLAAAAEAAALVSRSDIPGPVAQAVLGSGWAASAMLARSLPRALARDFGSAGATIGGLVHVQRLVSDAFGTAGIKPRLLPVVRALFDDAVASGNMGSDPAALVMEYEGWESGP